METLERARQDLPADVLAAEWLAGERMSPADVVAEFLGSEVHRQPASLSAREREVAALIARGLTNREIAHELGVSVRTADAHVEHIRNKISVRSRAQIAAWIVQKAP
jgi:non-specific serine/threonine protein kinase